LPLHLTAIAPASAGYVGFDMGMVRNVPFPWMQRYLMKISGRTHNDQLYDDLEYWNAAFAELSRGATPYRDFDVMIGRPSAVWREWVDHPERDAFWDAASPTDDEFARITLPVLAITGLYDDAQTGSLEFCRRHLANASLAAAAGQYLVIGPWDHAGTRDPKRHLGGLDFGPGSVLDVRQLHVDWYGWIMKGGPQPSFLADHFVYFIAGSNRWASAANLGAATRLTRTLYLSSPGASGGSVATRGALLDVPPARPRRIDSYHYDPALPAHNEGFEGADAVGPEYLVDGSSAERLDGDGLIYDTVPAPVAIEIVGRPRVVLGVSLDVPDTDIRIQLFEVKSDRSYVFLCQDQMRARYRKDDRRATLVTPGELEAYVFDRFSFVARTIAQGSVIRLVISPLGASIHQQRNRNSGRNVADETAKDNRAATVSVVLGRDSSWLELPCG
jgi:uncharacterized protein